jgi:hypothetical protein
MGWRDGELIDTTAKIKKPWEEDEVIDSTSTTPPLNQSEEKPILKNVTDYYTKDIPETVSGVVERTGERAQRILEPTVLGEKAIGATGAKGAAADIVESVAGTPERIMRTAAGAAGTAAEVPGAVLTLAGKVANRVTGGMVDGAIKLFGDSVSGSEPVKKAVEWWKGLSDAEKANYSAALDLSTLLGLKAGSKAADVIEGAGKTTKDVGTKFLGGEMKIKQSLAEKGYGKRIDQKKLKILNDISKYNLESPTGNFEKMANNAEAMASQKVKDADAILTTIASSPTAPKSTFVDDIILDAQSNIEDLVPVGKEEIGEKILDDITKGAIRRGQDGTKGVEVLVEFKKDLNNDNKLFVKGPTPDPNSVEAIETKIRRSLYLDAVSKIKSISPEAGELNKQAKELFDIAAVAGDAKSRISNREMISLTDRLIGVGSGVGAVGAMSSGQPDKAMMAVLGGLVISASVKGLGQGRGASTIIKGGKALQKAGKAIKKSKVLPAVGVGVGSKIFGYDYEE